MEFGRSKPRLISSFPPTHSVFPCSIRTLTTHLLTVIYYARSYKVSDLKELGLEEEIWYTNN